MRIPTAILVCVMILFIMNIRANGQAYSLKIENTRFDIDTASYNGYKTTFIQPYKEVKKTWWRYIKAKAIISNHLSHLELEIPSEKESNSSIYLVSTLEDDGGRQLTILRVALIESYMDAGRINDLNKELRLMLLEFKTEYFVSILQAQIKEQEKKSLKWSRELENVRSGKKGQEMSDEIRESFEKSLLSGLNEIEQNLDQLKQQLKEIK